MYRNYFAKKGREAKSAVYSGLITYKSKFKSYGFVTELYKLYLN